MKNEVYGELKLIVILSRMAVNQVHGSICTDGLKVLLKSEEWKKASLLDKQKLLKRQYKIDYVFASSEKRAKMDYTVRMIEEGLAAL